jgi:hypothetical protein
MMKGETAVEGWINLVCLAIQDRAGVTKNLSAGNFIGDGSGDHDLIPKF